MKLIIQPLRYILSIAFNFFFGLTLIIFHPIQIFCRHLVGKKMHAKSVNLMNFFLLKCLWAAASRSSYTNSHNIPDDKAVIIVSNHQSMYDVVMIVWYMRKHAPQFISKMELGRGIPSISYNLRHGGSVLIDRKNSRQAIPALINFAKGLAVTKGTAVIFPEGTRSKDGSPRSFAPNGLKTLLKYMPDAVIVPVTVNNSWKLVRNGMFPIGIGNRLSLEVHKPITNREGNTDVLIKMIETSVVAGIR